MNKREAEVFGRWLAKARHKLGLSANALSEIVGVDDSTINRLENGTILRPDAERLLRIGRALGLRDYEILRRAGLSIEQPVLPTLPAYLRVKYRHLPAPARDELKDYVERLTKRYGLDPNGPADGEDETPWDSHAA